MSGIRGISRGEPDCHEPPAPAHAAQRGFRQRATHRIDDDVGTVGQRLFQRAPQIAGRVVHEARGAVRTRHVELLGGRGDGCHRRTELDGELHGCRADPATGTEDHDLVAGLNHGDRAKHVVRGAMGHAERSRETDIDLGRDLRECLRSADRLLGEHADESCSDDAIAERDVGDVTGHLHDFAGELAARNERSRRRDLVLVGDEEHVGKVHRSGSHADARLTWTERRRRHLPDLDDLRWAVLVADGGAHLAARHLP